MPVRVVLDHPRGYAGLRLWRWLLATLGALLLVVGLIASLLAVPATILAAAWLAGENIEGELAPGLWLRAWHVLLAWAIVTPLAFIGVSRGLRLVRRGRSMVLFLRRFGYDEATAAVTFAVTRTIGSSWRVVTLDDAEIAPLGVPTGTRWLFGAVRGLSTTAVWTVYALLYVVPRLQMGLAIVVGADLVWARIWERADDPDAWMAVLDPYFSIMQTTLGGRMPIEAVQLDLPGVFALLAIGLAGIAVGLGTVLVAAPAAWAVGAVLLFAFSFTVDTVRDAELAKTRDVRHERDIGTVVHAVADRSRRVFGPRLVVLRVATAAWRQTVSRLASLATVSLVDVSDPSEALIWEIQELLLRSHGPCVFICVHERATEIASAGGSPTARALDRQVAQLLELQEILAYTTDRRGRRRFARALRSTLLSVSGS